MNLQEREERNEAIAIFSGGKKRKPRKAYNAPYWIIPGFNTHLGNPDKVYELYYHRSWEWLMPVVEKINVECNGWVTIKHRNCTIHPMEVGSYKTIEYDELPTIEAVFLAVSDFAKKINLINHPNP